MEGRYFMTPSIGRTSTHSRERIPPALNGNDEARLNRPDSSQRSRWPWVKRQQKAFGHATIRQNASHDCSDVIKDARQRGAGHWPFEFNRHSANLNPRFRAM
jgi:hypothetical protein